MRGVVQGVWVALAVAMGPTLPATAAEPEVTWARVRQEEIPAWRARLEVAQQRIEARERFFAGRGSLPEAFPDLVGRDLDEPAVIAGLLALRSEEDEARTAARVVALPELGATDRRAELDRARQAALDAEDRAAALERRALSGLMAHLDAHPALMQLDAVRGPLRAVVRAANEPGLDEITRADRQRAAAVADAELARLDALVAALRLAALVPSTPPPDPGPELARLASAAPGAAADRLRLVRPFLSASDRAAVDEALLAGLQAELDRARLEADRASAARDPVPAEVLTAEIAELEARLDALRTSQQAPGDDPVAALDQAVRAERVRAAEAALVRARAELQEGRAADPRSTEADAADARAEAVVALAEARDDAERRAAEVLAAAAEARSAAATAWQASHAAETTFDAEHAAASERLAAVRTQVAELQTAGLLAVDRPDPDAVYRELRSLLDAQRDVVDAAIVATRTARAAERAASAEVEAQRARLEAQRRSLAEADEPARSAGARAAEQWEEALDELVDARRAAVASARRGVDEALVRIRELHELRDAARASVSRDTLRRDRAHLLTDIVHEVGLLPARLSGRGRAYVTAVRSLPARAVDVNALQALFVGSFWLLVALVVWAALRRRAGAIALAVTRQVASVRPELVVADLRGALRPLSNVIEALLDLLVGWLVVGPVSALSRELAVGLVVYLHVVAYRFALAVFDLAFTKHPSFRPALRTLQPAVHERARRTVAAALGFVVLRRLVGLVTVELGLHTVAAVAQGLLTVAGALLFVWVASTWEPVLRAAVAQRRQDRRLNVLLGQAPKHWSLAAPHAVASFVLLTVAFGVGVVPRLAREGTQLGTLVTRLGTFGLAGTVRSTGEHDRLSAVVIDRLLAPGPQDCAVPRAEAAHAVVEEIRAWRSRGGPSLVVVAGEQGEGKSSVLDEVAARLGGDVVRVALPPRLVTERDAAAWLIGLAGVEPPAGAALGTDAAIDALMALPPAVWLVDDLHLALLRVVGGFDGLRALLYATSATATRHVWVATAHRPAWRHVRQLGDLVDTSSVRRTIELRPMGERELRELTVARARSAGLELDYGSLVRPSVLGDDPSVELERSVSLFYRLLADQSAGNPSTAMHLWSACLAPDGPHRARVVVDDILYEQAVLNLHELFVLGALRTHDRLTEAELIAVTNLDPAVVRGVVHQLDTRGMVRPRDGRMRVPAASLARVTRALVRKNVVQWG